MTVARAGRHVQALTAAMGRYPVTSGLDAATQSLEDVFLHFYGKEAQSRMLNGALYRQGLRAAVEAGGYLSGRAYAVRRHDRVHVRPQAQRHTGRRS
ncbi:MAG: hypothetical protein V8T36_04915 [Ruthenibacterium lactatiformans]